MKEPRQKDRLEAELTSSCDKYGHSFGDEAERFPRRWPQSRTNTPLADRFGHICRSAELASTGDEEAGENGTGILADSPCPVLVVHEEETDFIEESDQA